jgi:hypothetical protein
VNLAEAENWARHYAPTHPELAELITHIDHLRADLLWHTSETTTTVRNLQRIDHEMSASLNRLTTALTGEQVQR